MIEQSVSTVIDPFNLDKNMEETISRMIIDKVSLPKDSRTRDILSTDLYMDGFRYYDFKDDLSHDASTSFLMCYLNSTPEKVMLSIANKARVVGLSATASIQTVTGNYNIEYLEDALKEKFYKLDNQDYKRIKDKVEQRIKHNYKISVNVEKTPENDVTAMANSIFNQSGFIEKYEGVFSDYSDENDDNFQLRRLIKTILAIRDFIVNDSSKVILVLTNKNLKLSGSSDIFCKEMMKQIVEDIAKDNGKLVPKVHHLFGNDFETQRKEYNDEIKRGDKIILFSSYPSVGTGQNLQYEENVGDEVTKRDIDSIYIENPTHILVSTDNLKEESQLIKYIYQMETLKKNGEINAITALRNIKTAFKKFDKPSFPYKFSFYSYNAESVNNHKVKILVQAIGRICRTGGDRKRHDVNIYVDDEIIGKIDFDCIKNKLINPEFKEIIKLSQHTSKPEQISKNLNMAFERNLRITKRIENILSENKVSWQESDIDTWKKLREFVLKHPTISRQDLNACRIKDDIKGIRDFYLESLDGEVINSYQYMPDFDINGAQKELFPIQYFKIAQKGYVTINDEECRLKQLMRIPDVEKGFKEAGYATCFEPNELIILPTVYQNIYKGALGEEAGRILLNKYGIKLNEITDTKKFEKFDYQLDGYENVYVDFKNWSENDLVNRREYLEKSLKKLENINGQAALIINLVASDFIIKGNKILEISSLTKKSGKCAYPLDEKEKIELIKRIKEVVEIGNH